MSLVLRYFAVLHLARSVLELTYSYDLARGPWQDLS